MPSLAKPPTNVASDLLDDIRSGQSSLAGVSIRVALGMVSFVPQSATAKCADAHRVTCLELSLDFGSPGRLWMVLSVLARQIVG